MSFELEFEVEPGRKIRVPIGVGADRVVIGRLKDCAVKTDNRTVSRRHAEFTWTNGQVQVRDLDSTGGTFVNGERVGRSAVSVGDSLLCGKMEGRLVGKGGGGAKKLPDDLGDDSSSKSKSGGGGTAMLDAMPGGDDIWAVDDGSVPAREPKEEAGLGPATRRADEPSWVTGPQKPVSYDEVPDRAVADRFERTEAPEPEPAAQAEPEPEPEPAEGSFEVSFVDHDGSSGSFTIGPGDVAVLGRGKKADVKVKHPTVSRAHARFEYRDGKVQVTDLNSSAGTYVHERKIRRQLAEPGDPVRCGKLELTLSAAAGQGWSRAPADAPWTLGWTDIEGVPHAREIGPGDPPVVIGRNPGVDLRIPDSTVGRQHAEVFWRDGTLHVTDKKSTNGTFINDKRTKGGPLAAGDSLRCGSFPFTITAPAADAGWEDEWGDDWTDVDEMTPPEWLVLFRSDDGFVELEHLGLERRLVAIGADPDCEISADSFEMEPDHCEITWEEGVLVVNDLNTAAGTWVRGRKVDEKVLKNGDVITCGTFQVHVVRASASRQAKERSSGRISEDAQVWAERFELRDPQLCLVYCYGDENDPDFAQIGREELTLWSDGEAQIEDVFAAERVTSTARVRESLVELLLGTLMRARFPDVTGGALEDSEFPVEIAAYQDEDEVSTLLGHKAIYRADSYREAVDLLRSIAALVRGLSD